MARPKAGKPVKAESIRQELATNPKGKASEIVRTLAAKGVKVSANHVYAIKMHSRASSRRAKRAAAEESATRSGMSNPVDAVLQVRVLSVKLGGIKQLKRLVDLLAE